MNIVTRVVFEGQQAWFRSDDCDPTSGTLNRVEDCDDDGSFVAWDAEALAVVVNGVILRYREPVGTLADLLGESMKRFWWLLIFWPTLVWAQAWPDVNAYWTIRPHKTAGMEMTDPVWAHLHLNSPEANSVSLACTIDHLTMTPFTNFAGAQLQIRYTVHGIPVSGWLTTPPYAFVLDFNNAGLASLSDGIHDLSVEIQGLAGAGSSTAADPPVKQDFRPSPMFLHIGGRSTPSTTVPILAQNLEDARVDASQGTGNYVNAATLTPTAYPATTTVVPWSGTPPYSQDLSLEQLGPHSREFSGMQMLWEEPPGTVNAGLRFIRSLPPKFASNYLDLWNNGGQVAVDAFGYSGHRSLPVKDGGRGVGWTNGYVQGVVDADGVLWMVNVSGQLRIMKPDGELITLVGWRVRSDKQPVWMLKPMTSIRTNMEFRGAFTSGGWPDAIDPGWHEPMDVALDPNDNTKVYVASLYDNAIYRVDVNRTTWVGTVTLIAGDINHQAGFVDATGDQARFNHPVSLVASLDGTKLYVSDQENDAIRVVTLATGAVTTLYSSPGLSTTLQAAGVTCSVDLRLVCYPASAVRARVHVTVSAGDATVGVRPDIYAPFWIRISSTGNLVLFDRGLNSLRVINPTTHVTIQVDQLGDGGFGNYARDWVWGDVDKTGHAGAVDGIYWGNIVSLSPPPLGETEDRFNENYRYTSLDGTVHSWVFGPSRLYHPEDVGPVALGSPPHYPWLIAVDPRGAVIFGGIGDHGLVRLRKRRASDPTIPDDLTHLDARRVWESGAPSPLGFYYTITNNVTNTVVDPPALLYGWGGHNMIGASDTWSITPTTTDAAIDSLFTLNTAITSNAGAHAAVLAFLRAHSEGTAVPPAVDVTPPTVSVTAPAAGTVSGTVPVTSTAADNVAVVGVQFLLDDLALQAEDTSSPYAISWDTTAAVPNGAHTLKARARDAAGNVTTSTGVNVTVSNTAADVTAPAVSVTAPTGTVSLTQTVTATATDAVGVVGVQFKLDGLLLGAEDTTAPYSISWDTTGTSNAAHVLTAIARDAAGNVGTSANDNVTVSNASPDVTAPNAVSVTTAPASVSGTITLDATASDNIAVTGVQFKMDGAVLNPEDTSAPYSISWDTTTASNTSHTITVTARDAAGNTTTSAGVAFTVSNTVTPPPVDTTIPVVLFTSPVSGTTVSGSVTLQVTATDNVAVASVQFLVDGTLFGAPDTSVPYRATWIPTTGGSHVLSAKAVDTTGNIATAIINVLVPVPTPGTPCPTDPLIVRVTHWPSGNPGSPTNRMDYQANKQTVGYTFVQSPREATFTDVRGCVAHVR